MEVHVFAPINNVQWNYLLACPLSSYLYGYPFFFLACFWMFFHHLIQQWN